MATPIPFSRKAKFTLRNTDRVFFSNLKHAAEKAESNTGGDMGTFCLMQKMLLASFKTDDALPFPPEHVIPFWRTTLDMLFPQYRGFINTMDANALLRVAQSDSRNRYDALSSAAPWHLYEYRRLATAVVNTAEKFLRESAAA